MGQNRAPAALTAALEAIGVSDATTSDGVAVRRKYGNQPTEVDGHRFDSKKEAARYSLLRSIQASGGIRDLEVHPRFPLVVHGQDCGTYVADFAYVVTQSGERVVEDVKSAATRALPTYRLKRRLLWALYGLTVQEV
jgi:hypothetical protein